MSINNFYFYYIKYLKHLVRFSVLESDAKLLEESSVQLVVFVNKHRIILHCIM